LADFIGPKPERRIPGLRNLVTFGVATTHVLQNLRSIDRETFDAWYAPVQADMRQDPLMRFFWDLRSQILKEGHTGEISTTFTIAGSFDVNELMANPPPGAKELVFGDESGSTYWLVPQADGTMAKYHVALPESMKATVTTHFAKPPDSHRGKPIEDTSIQNLARLYLAYLLDVLEKAVDRFVPKTTSTASKLSS
jgi:hypothetical protein